MEDYMRKRKRYECQTIILLFLGLMINTVSAQFSVQNDGGTVFLKVFNTGQVAIGNHTPDTGTKLDVDGKVKTLSFQMANGTNLSGKVLTSDADGNASWQNLPPYPPEQQGLGDVLTISEDGNGKNIVNVTKIGVGTSTPTGQVHIAASGNTTIPYYNRFGTTTTSVFAYDENFGGTSGTVNIALQGISANDQATGSNTAGVGVHGSVMQNSSLVTAALLGIVDTQRNECAAMVGEMYDGNFAGFTTFSLYLSNSVTTATDNYMIYADNPDVGGPGLIKSAIPGRLGIGVSEPNSQFRLHTKGSINVEEGGIWLHGTTTDPQINIGGTGGAGDGYALYVAGDAYCTGTWGPSDIKYKKDIATISGALDKINQINGVYFNWRQNEFPQMNFNEGRNLGVIAQELETVVPELVMTTEDGSKSVSYDKLSVLLIEAVKELANENKQLVQRINELEMQ